MARNPRFSNKPLRPGKKFEVIKATTKDIDGLEIGGRKYRFGPNGSMYISDKGVANEIEKEFGHRVGNGDVTVSPVEVREPGHKYFFGAITSQTFRDNFDRIFRMEKWL